MPLYSQQRKIQLICIQPPHITLHQRNNSNSYSAQTVHPLVAPPSSSLVDTWDNVCSGPCRATARCKSCGNSGHTAHGQNVISLSVETIAGSSVSWQMGHGPEMGFLCSFCCCCTRARKNAECVQSRSSCTVKRRDPRFILKVRRWGLSLLYDTVNYVTQWEFLFVFLELYFFFLRSCSAWWVLMMRISPEHRQTNAMYRCF